jgi:hypothetical protein
LASKYSVECRDGYGQLVANILRPQNKSFSLYRNKAGACTFTLDLFDPQANYDIFKLNQYDIVFRRLGTPIFAGQISMVTPHIDGDDKKMDITATGYYDLLDSRYITMDYPGYDALHNNVPFADTDSGEVIAQLIENTQFPLTSEYAQLLSSSTISFNQSFIPAGDGSITEIRLLLTNTSAVGNIMLGLYTDSSDSPNTLVANSQITVASSTIPTDMSWVTFNYSSNNPVLSTGVKYWIKLTTDTNQATNCGIAWSWLNSYDFYTNGRAYSPENPSLFTPTTDFQFFIKSSDNSFQMTKNCYLGFNKGTIATSFDIAPVYTLYKKMKSCIDDVSSNHDGVDFNFTVSIDPVTNLMTKYYNVFYPRQGVDNTSLIFQYPGNIKKISKSYDGKNMVNETAVRGQGSGIDQVIVTIPDPTSIQTYSLRQDVDQESDVPDEATLTTLGQEYVRIRKDPLDLPEVTLDGNVEPFVGSYGIGDQIYINAQFTTVIDISQIYRIEELNCVIDDNDMEEVNLTLSIV